MNNLVKCGISFVVGGALCSSATVFLVKKHYSKKADLQIEEMRAYFSEKYEKNEEKEVFVEDSEESKTETAQYLVEKFKYVPPTEQELAEKEHPSDDFEEKIDEKEAEKYVSQDIPTNKLRDPFQILEEEYINDRYFEKVSVVYYDGDGTLSDEDESMMDIGSSIGLEAIDLLDDYDPLYIRNEKLGIDYEITVSPLAYSEYVLGIQPKDIFKYRHEQYIKDKENEEDHV